MNAQTAAATNVVSPARLGHYRLYHREDGTFQITIAQGDKVEVPLLEVHTPLSPIEMDTGRERHALFVRHCEVQAEEATLWDERVIDGVPVRWEILLCEENNGDLCLQMHFLTYGSLQAQVYFLLDFIPQIIYTKAFSCPYPSALVVTPQGAFSVITMEPAQPGALHAQGEGRMVWVLPVDHLHRQTLRLRIHHHPGQEESEQALIQHVEYRASLFREEYPPLPSFKLRAAAQSAVALLLNPDGQWHFAEDQVALRVAPGDRRLSAFTLAAAKALLDWYRFSGDESALWTARLAINSAMDFQVVDAQNPNSGACWDTVDERKRGSDITGQQRFHLYRSARLLQQMLLLHRDTGSELCVRVALNGISWLLLKRGATGMYDGAVVLPDGVVQQDRSAGIMGAIISVMCAAYSLTETEAYMHAAKRLSEYLLRDGCLWLSPGAVLPAERLPGLSDDVFAAAAAVEGLARLYRAYPHEPLKSGALRMMQWLRLWQLPTAMAEMGEAGEVLAGQVVSGSYADAGVEAARGALWAFWLSRDTRWFAYATHALHAAASLLDPLAGFPGAKLAYPDHVSALAALVRTYLHWLLSIPALAPQVDCDPDLLVCQAGNRVFVPEPCLWGSIHVQARGLIDWMALVCPATHDLLLAVLTDGSSSAALVDTGERRQIATDLIGGNTGTLYPLHVVPGVGSVGVYMVHA
jgi:hypothetical protein